MIDVNKIITKFQKTPSFTSETTQTEYLSQLQELVEVDRHFRALDASYEQCWRLLNIVEARVSHCKQQW